MNRRRFLRAGAAVAAAVVAPRPLRALARRPAERYVERWSWAMGQPVRIELFAPSEDLGLEAAAAALAELRRVEGLLSRFDEASDLAELNRRAGRGWVALHPEAVRVLRRAGWFRRATGGAFDLAVEPLMRAWGFREPRSRPPSRAELAEARDAVRGTRVRVAGNRVALEAAHAALDPGGIGVGYGLDRAGEALRSAGIRRAFVDVSGDCLALGAPPGAVGWEVAVVDSAAPARQVARIRLRDEALATSSNEVSVVRLGALTEGHVMDPARGRPARALRQATVVAATAMEADALSTALLVAGRPGAGARRVWALAP